MYVASYSIKTHHMFMVWKVPTLSLVEADFQLCLDNAHDADLLHFHDTLSRRAVANRGQGK